MAGERVKLEVQARERGGSADARRLRADGYVPGVLYGAGKPAQAFTVHERALRDVLTGEHGTNAILDVTIGDGGKPHHAVLKDYQLHPIRKRLLHIDLQEVRLDVAIQSSVSIELIGESEGVKFGGVLTQVTREVLVEALPMNVPDKIELDIAAMEIGDSLRVSDLKVPADVTVLADPDEVLASVIQPRVEEEPETVEAVEGEEGEEGVEGEAAEGAEDSGESSEDSGDESSSEG